MPVPLVDLGAAVGGPATHVEDLTAVHGAQAKQVIARIIDPEPLVVAAVPVPLNDRCPVVEGGLEHVENPTAVQSAQRKLTAAEGLDPEESVALGPSSLESLFFPMGISSRVTTPYSWTL